VLLGWFLVAGIVQAAEAPVKFLFAYAATLDCQRAGILRKYNLEPQLIYNNHDELTVWRIFLH